MRLVSTDMLGLDASIEEAIRDLGASRWGALRQTTLLKLRSSIVAASLLSFIVFFGNLELSLALGGPSKTALPITIMQYLELKLDSAIVVDRRFRSFRRALSYW